MRHPFSAPSMCSSSPPIKRGLQTLRLRPRRRKPAACFQPVLPELARISPNTVFKPLDAGAEAWAAQAIDLYRHPTNDRASAVLAARPSWIRYRKISPLGLAIFTWPWMTVTIRNTARFYKLCRKAIKDFRSNKTCYGIWWVPPSVLPANGPSASLLLNFATDMKSAGLYSLAVSVYGILSPIANFGMYTYLITDMDDKNTVGEYLRWYPSQAFAPLPSLNCTP